MITITNLQKTYNSKEGQVEALKGISLKIEKGQIFGIIGFSGAGKSSLIRCLNMLETPTGGSIIVNGQEMTQLETAELRSSRRKIGMIFQHFNLLETATVFDNVAVALEISDTPKDIIKKKTNELLKIVGLEDKVNHYPSQLSGGQKQRVAIARSLANDIDVLLCDEATSALDPQTTDSILELLLDINQKFKITIVLITHEMHVIKKICDKVAVIEDGIIIEEGEVIDVFTNPQSSTTKNFIKSILEDSLDPEIIETLKKSGEYGKTLRLSFVGQSAGKPVLAKIAKELPLWPNILGGNIVRLKNQTFGRLVIRLEGEKKAIDQGITMLKNNMVKVEIIDDDLS